MRRRFAIALLAVAADYDEQTRRVPNSFLIPALVVVSVLRPHAIADGVRAAMSLHGRSGVHVGGADLKLAGLVGLLLGFDRAAVTIDRAVSSVSRINAPFAQLLLRELCKRDEPNTWSDQGDAAEWDCGTDPSAPVGHPL